MNEQRSTAINALFVLLVVVVLHIAGLWPKDWPDWVAWLMFVIAWCA